MSAKKKSKLKKRIIIGVVVVVVIGLAAAALLRPKQTAYQTVKAETGDITSYYSFSGNIETKNRQTVVSEKMMQVSDIKVKEGDMVKEGDVLAKTTTGDEIKANIDGEITNLSVEENKAVMAGITLMEIVDYNNLEISVKVDEYNITALQIGKETTVTVGALDKEMKGTVRTISKEGKVQSGVTYFTATIDLAKDSSLRVGMSAEVKLVNESAKNVVTLAMTAVQFDNNNKPYVLKADAKGLPVRTDITAGINDGVTVEIKSGVTSGDTILYTKTASKNSGFGQGRASGGNS